MAKDIDIENNKNIKNTKNGSGSKTSKPIKSTSKYNSKSIKKSMKKTVSGSKTSTPKKTVIKNTIVNNVDDVEQAVDIKKIFDIIESETKRNEITNKKQKQTLLEEKQVLKLFDTDKNNHAAKSTSANVNKKLVETEISPKKIIKKTINKKKIINVTDDASDDNTDEKLIINTTNNNNDKMNKMAVDSYSEAKKFLKEHNITISTITLDCKLHTLIDVDKFAKKVILKEDEIVSVKFGNRKDAATNRTIVVIKTKKKPSKKNFYNQVTILMKPMNNPSRNYINIKVFKNGSLQMTGCKDMDDFNNVATTLINILKRGYDAKTKKGKNIHIDFIDNPKEIGIYDVKIRMINSNFKLDYKVDRKKLARLLKKNHGEKSKDKEIGYVECKYEPTGGHSCVNIKYKYDEINKPSIFVFQTGAVIITGAKNLPQIIMAYHFIHKILNKYHDEIKIIDLDQKAVQAEIVNFFKNLKKNQTILTDKI